MLRPLAAIRQVLLEQLQRSSLGWIIGGWVASTLAVWTVLEDAVLSAAFVGRLAWLRIVGLLGGQPPTPEFPDNAVMPLGVLGGLVAVALVVGVGLASRRRTLDRALTFVGQVASIPGLWLVGLYASLLTGWTSGYAVLGGTFDLVFALCSAAVIAVSLAPPENQTRPIDGYGETSGRTASLILAGLLLCYVVPFVAMNWGQYWNLRTPHGDTAMYEEHLWNVLHGKGFRSYLDQGLFLGEHIQVVHLLLIPVYLLYPSHLTLELCESVALASAAIPAYLIAARHSGSRQVGLWIAAAVLLYAPLHYLDIEIDRKSFRPICFGVPAMLWVFHCAETKRWGKALVAAVIALMSKEDYALILGPFGLWVAWDNWREAKALMASSNVDSPSRGFAKTPWFGLAITAASAVYLLLAVKVIIPWFRGGETVHYARYFSQFGETPLGILWGMLTKPGVLFESLVKPATVLYVLRLLAPLAFTPLMSPSRFLVGVPVLGLLLLNQLSLDPPSPVHHFHAPLVPVLIWAMAAAVGSIASGRENSGDLPIRFPSFLVPRASFLTYLPVTAALLTGLTLSFSPASLGFWESGRGTYWRTIYVPDERAAQFAKVIAEIPLDARVASTDYVHPRFTHHERSYDYSGYVRKVAGYENRVPDDTDYIVLDVRGPYSEIAGPGDVRELQTEPTRWERLPDTTNGYFIVLRRRADRDE